MIDWSYIANGPEKGGDILYQFVNSEILTRYAFQFLVLFFLGLMRIIPIVATVPFLGSRVLPTPVKVIQAIVLFFVFIPTIAKVTNSDLKFDYIMLLLAAKEFLIGLILGFFISLPFTLMQSVGILIDHQRGSASLMVNDPATQNQSSPLGLFFNLILIAIFYKIDGPFYFFDLINTSYELIPPDHFLSPHFFNEKSPFWVGFIPLMNQFVSLTVQLAAPSLILILMTDFFLGIANRLAPQVQIIFLGLGLKAAIPVVVIALGWNLFLDEATKQSMLEIQSLRKIVYEMGGMVEPEPAQK